MKKEKGFSLVIMGLILLLLIGLALVIWGPRPMYGALHLPGAETI